MKLLLLCMGNDTDSGANQHFYYLFIYLFIFFIYLFFIFFSSFFQTVSPISEALYIRDTFLSVINDVNRCTCLSLMGFRTIQLTLESACHLYH